MVSVTALVSQEVLPNVAFRGGRGTAFPEDVPRIGEVLRMGDRMGTTNGVVPGARRRSLPACGGRQCELSDQLVMTEPSAPSSTIERASAWLGTSK